MEVLTAAAVGGILLFGLSSMHNTFQTFTRQTMVAVEASSFRNMLLMIFQSAKNCDGALVAPGRGNPLPTYTGRDMPIAIVRMGSTGKPLAQTGKLATNDAFIESMTLKAPTLISPNIRVNGAAYDEYFTTFEYKLKARAHGNTVPPARELPILMLVLRDRATNKISKCVVAKSSPDICSMFPGLVFLNGQCVATATPYPAPGEVSVYANEP